MGLSLDTTLKFLPVLCFHGAERGPPDVHMVLKRKDVLRQGEVFIILGTFWS